MGGACNRRAIGHLFQAGQSKISYVKTCESSIETSARERFVANPRSARALTLKQLVTEMRLLRAVESLGPLVASSLALGAPQPGPSVFYSA